MPKISVIIPVYNTEKYLPKCLDSVCNQTLSDIEVICIDDCSTDESLDILKKYAKKDERIKLIEFKENKGAAAARNFGIKEAKGEYIAFLDSDDYPETSNFYETLYLKALEAKADIVKGAYKNSDTGFIDEIINNKIKEDKNNFCSTYCSAIFRAGLIKENNILFPEIIDMEDPVFAFSCALKAGKIAIVDDLFVIITKREDSITSQIPTFAQIKDKIRGLNLILELANSNNILPDSYAYVVGYWFCTVFSDSFVNRQCNICDYIVKHTYQTYRKIKYKDTTQAFIKTMSPGILKYFDNYTEKCSSDIDRIKKEIDRHEVISFDIFDTLLVRPFIKPVDIFQIIAQKYNEPDFFQQRILAERIKRTRMSFKNKKNEDINFDEIYDEIDPKYLKFKDIELDYEKQILKPDLIMQDVYNYALKSNKTIIITSDMYMRKDFLQKLLYSNGYSGFKELYVSSEIRKCKSSGSLFKFIINDLKDEINGNPTKILHIGDNYRADYKMAKAAGVDACYYSSIKDSYLDNYLNKKNENFFHLCDQSITSRLINLNYVNCNNENRDYWYELGYSYGGMLILAFIKAIFDFEKERKFSDIFFVARDAYPLKIAYEIIKKEQNSPNCPKTHYVYAQRKIKAQCMPKENNPEYNLVIENEYIKYINSLQLKGNNIAIIDSCAGLFTAQGLIENYLPDKSFLGIYLVTNLNFKYNYANLLQETGGTVKFNWNLAELLLTSAELPIVGIKNLKPVYNEKCDNEELLRQKIYSKIQKGEIDFIKNYVKYYGVPDFTTESFIKYVHNLLGYYWQNLDNTDKIMLSKIKHPMDISSKEYLSLLVDPSKKSKDKEREIFCEA